MPVDRTERAVAAATAAGRELGLRVDAPRVLYDVFSVIVHLAPTPVVVRVPTVLPPSYRENPDAQTAQQRAELAVAGWLYDNGHPVVPPSPLVAREPVRAHGFSMTFWQLVAEAPEPQPDYVKRVATTARLHAVLRDYDGPELGFWVPFRSYIPESLVALERLPELLSSTDVQRAQQEWSVIAPIMESQAAFEAAFPGVEVQPIHGDAPYYNMIGELWSDFELVTLGPRESDLALAGPEITAAYDDAAVALGSRPLDPRVRRVTDAAGSLAAVAVLAQAPDLPMLVEAMRPTVDQWRAREPFTGI